jgi:NADP-dependent 3-hydroxy acid dehydrogenase YdfG
MRRANTVAIVTGAETGIDAAIARLLPQEGAQAMMRSKHTLIRRQ